jgi:uncharacterized protein (TIGR02147 family)
MSTSEPTVFDFADFREYLRYRIDREIRSPNGHKRLNLQRLSLLLGYKSPSLLSMVIQGSRLPSDDLLEALSIRFQLKDCERDHLMTLVKLARCTAKGKDVAHLLKRLEVTSQGTVKSHKLSLQQFEVIRDWYCFVIKEMVSAKDFQEDPVWISRKLRRKVTPAQVQHALTNLLSVGLLHINSETQKLEIAEGFTETTHDVSSAAIRAHHLGMMKQAMDALEEQPVEARHFNSLSLKFDPERTQEAKKFILEFVKTFNGQFGAENTSDVYQLNVQFFSHTRGSDEF